MNISTSALVVVLLTTTLCAITLSEEVSPLACPDTAQRELQDISQIFKCETSFAPEKGVAMCQGDFQYGSVTLAFKILEKVPESTAMCLGLQYLSVNNLDLDRSEGRIYWRFDFNPLLTVGILTVDHLTNRSCNISMLSDILKLETINDLREWAFDLWNFSSPLFGAQLKWFQGLTYDGRVIYVDRLQNTSIQLLNVTGANVGILLLKNMPFLRKVIFTNSHLEEFHKDSFLGMSDVKILILRGTFISGIPQMIDRMPKLEILEISGSSLEGKEFTIPRKELSTLKNLQVLDLKYNSVSSLSEKLPPLPKLRTLRLDGCNLSSIEKRDFVGLPELVELTLSGNMLTNLENNAFRPLKKLKLLDLSSNRLTKWPVLYDLPIILLDMSDNLLSDVVNLSKTRTTVEILNISNNRILEWHDKYVFSLPKSLMANDAQFNMHHSGDSTKKNYELWTKKIYISKNLIRTLSETMMQSLEGLDEVDLGGNEFDCFDCRMIPFQKWLNTTSTIVSNLGTSDPLLCSSPVTWRGVPVNVVQYDEELCLEKVRTTNLLTIIGVPLLTVVIMIVVIAGIIYKFRSRIGYILLN
ncbi:nephrocan isoform X2 [Anabrus simplex]|uniref:nephrocan isoform X2 n=1 Tax=Anabrus simplex TaxID=316456 RepID=UPI0035A2D278